jgi:hypothetical protein
MSETGDEPLRWLTTHSCRALQLQDRRQGRTAPATEAAAAVQPG